MFKKNKAGLAILVATLVGGTAYAQQNQGGYLFTASGVEAVEGNSSFEFAKSSATVKANEHCSPNKAERVSNWTIRREKAGYLWMATVTATFTCVARGQ